MAKTQEDISVTVFASDENDKGTTLKELKAATCRFSVAIIVLKSDDKADWIDNLSNKSIEKAIIAYERPVNIELARTVRDKLVEAGVSEIKDYFYDKNLREDVTNYINSWNDCPAEEVEIIKIGKYIKRRAKATKDAPINLYASAMIGKMGELLLKLNKLANTFADVMLSYFQQEGAGTGVDEDSPYDFGSASRERPKLKGKKIPHQKENKAKPEDIPSWKSQIENALAEKNGNVWQPSEGSPHLPKILLIGDSGVGKSLVANYIHEIVTNKLGNALKEKKNRPARIGIPEFEKKEDDLEYSLFGYASNAFTGASENGNLGLLLDNICQVVFLDEIGAATSAIQNKLLTYLDDYKVRPRGMNDDIFCPTLVVAATNEWAKLKNPKLFRSDLLARFTDRLDIPNIKERINNNEENLLYLLDCILQDEHINPEINGLKVESIGENAFAALYNHFKNGCTGNFRELENLMREACEQARKDKRDYMVQQDVLQAINNLHLSLATSQEESTQASASMENAASSQAPQTEIEQAPEKREGINDSKKEITPEDKEKFCERCHILKSNDDVRKQVLDIILKDNTKGYSRIIDDLKKIKDLNLPEGDIPKSFASAVQRLDSAIRKFFHLPSCREACKKLKSINR